MAVQEAQVKVGAFFMTLTDQLRKVTALEKDEQQRNRVHYLSKSGKISGRNFEFGHNKSNPPLLATFVNDCDRLLSDQEITKLKIDNIILADE